MKVLTMRDSYYIDVAASQDQETCIEDALRAIYEQKLERFDVVRCRPAFAVSARENRMGIYRASGRIYFYGTTNDADALKKKGFNVQPSTARYPEPSTPELHQ